MSGSILAIDQGTTSSRALVFDRNLRVIGVGQQEFAQHFPRSGWVEHEPEDLWQTTLETCRMALAQAGLTARDLAAIGITNQRETTVVWDRITGRAIHKAIVWQDRRTADVCAKLRAEGAEALITQRTGLLLDPYFSGTKVAWILDHAPGARVRAEKGELAFGTVDSFLLWRLTGGRVHATDATNASVESECRCSTRCATSESSLRSRRPARGLARWKLEVHTANCGEACSNGLTQVRRRRRHRRERFAKDCARLVFD